MADDIDEALERRMELTQFRPGDVLTAENIAEIRALFDELEDECEDNATLYDQGIQRGREDAAGKEVATLLQKIDALETELAAQKALTRFYAAIAAPNPAEGDGKLRPGLDCTPQPKEPTND